MRRDKKMENLFEIVLPMPSNEEEICIMNIANNNGMDWNYMAEMSLAGALKTVAKGTKYEEISNEIIDKCCLITKIEKEQL